MTIDERFVSGAKMPPLAQLPAVADPFQRVGQLTTDEFEAALLSLEGKLGKGQRSMLLGHAAAPGHALSMEEIAHLGGFAKSKGANHHSVANLHYGKVGKLFKDYFAVAGLENHVQAIAQTAELPNERGHALWVLRPALIEAMERLGMAEPQVERSATTAAVEAEIDADPHNTGLTSTERRALVNARLGQGGYRRRMFRVWDGRCAVTGCAIECVLIASHAKPWAESDNSERLDEYNGLLLAASVDRLFDSGLIAFSDDGKLLTAPSLDLTALTSIGLSSEAQLSAVHDRHRAYLRAHRMKNGFESDPAD